MLGMIDPVPIRDRFTALSPHLNERDRRLFAATEAATAGYGGIAAVSAATGIAVSTIGRGLKDLVEAGGLLAGRGRGGGGGGQAVYWQAGYGVQVADASRWSRGTLACCLI